MSWQAGSFALLALVLLAGFGWYERRRPPAKVLALVAALAALAVIGRIAFAADSQRQAEHRHRAVRRLRPGGGAGLRGGCGVRPRVELLPRPGAVDGLADGRLGRGGRGRRGARQGDARAARSRDGCKLALACGAAGLAFGAWMDVYQWTLAARQDLDTYLAVSGTSLPYNLAHAIGNVVFCLLIGPAFVRALTRYRQALRGALARRPCRWRRPSRSRRCSSLPGRRRWRPRPASRAARYLERAQNDDGGFGPAPGAASNQLHTGWAALGLASAGRNPRDVRAPRRPLDRRLPQARRRRAERHRRDRADDPGAARRRALADRLRRPQPAARADAAGAARTARSPASRATRASASSPCGRPGERVGKKTARWFVRAQSDDGGFGVSPAAASDSDMTGVGLQALAAIGRSRGAAARSAVAWLRGAQNADGGFSLTQGRRLELAVHGVRGHGPDRRRAPATTSSAAASRTCGRGSGRRQRRLLGDGQPDAGLGHGAGAARASGGRRSRCSRCRASGSRAARAAARRQPPTGAAQSRSAPPRRRAAARRREARRRTAKRGRDRAGGARRNRRDARRSSAGHGGPSSEDAP